MMTAADKAVRVGKGSAMTDQPKGVLRSAFVETGLLVVGGIAGGALTYWLLGDNWLLNVLGAVAGAWLANAGARHLAGKRMES